MEVYINLQGSLHKLKYEIKNKEQGYKEENYTPLVGYHNVPIIPCLYISFIELGKSYQQKIG